MRSLHERLFYRPLLSAVAALPDDGYALTSEQAEARLAAIGFQDPRGALHHIAALTAGVSRRAEIQRHLLPVMLQWFAEGADPDYGLLAFRRLSDDLGEAYWFLRMLRDSSGAARRLTEVLSSSRFVGVLFERIPEAAAWLESDGELRPRPRETLMEETAATVARHADDVDAAALALRTARRREVLRLALAGILGMITIGELGVALSDITTAELDGVLALAHRPGDGIEFGVVAMGRYGGEELGFGSDADVVYVYRTAGAADEEAQQTAEAIVKELTRLTEDLRLPLDLDIGLRPEGKNGAVVRSLDSYRAYYARWSLTWEAQALLRARGVAGDAALLRDFEALADETRYPASISAADVREVKRIKARVESERLPQGADPRPAPQARARLAERRGVVRAAVAARARGRHARAEDHLDAARPGRRGRCGLRRARRRGDVARGVDHRLPGAVGDDAVDREDRRRAADRPARARRGRAADGVPAGQRVPAGGGLPPHDAAGPPRLRARVLREAVMIIRDAAPADRDAWGRLFVAYGVFYETEFAPASWMPCGCGSWSRRTR